MRPIGVADAETDPFGEYLRLQNKMPEPFIWGLFLNGEYHEFNSTEEFAEFISRQKAIIYAHNGGKFDWHFLLEYLEPESPVMVINGRISKVKLGDCELRDSYNILPMPLSAYKKDEIDYSIMRKENRNKPDNMKKIRQYLEMDCRYLYELVNGFISNYGLHLTQASAAMNIWSAMTETDKPKTDGHFYSIFCPYYYGGRVECFRLGEIHKPFKVADINSAYPFAMLHDHPWGTTPDISRSLPNSQSEIQRAFIRLTARSLGAFPYRGGDSLSFPNDGVIREFTITGWEFIAARDTGALRDWEIIEVLTLPEKISFGQYVNHFYELKNKSKGVDHQQYIFAKLFLNSLYGKFAANPQEYQEFVIVEPRFIEVFGELNGYDYACDLGPWALMQKGLDEHKQRFYNVATAASITGFVRAYLWRAICNAKGVIYCDTDSLVCEDVGDIELGRELGQWDLEAECTEGAIAGKKLYALKRRDGTYKVASKGVRLSPGEIYEIARGHTVKHYSDVPTFSLKTGKRYISRQIKMLHKQEKPL